MDRREFIAAAGTVAAVASASQAFAQTGEDNMHPPKYKALEETAGHCVATGYDCLRHCLGMYKMKDTSMSDCADSAFQLVNACNTLAALAAVNSEHTGHLAKVVAMICRDCQKECEKFPKVAECKACADSCKACAAECDKVAA
jgi:Cys-rich four helix bundle protein (predicted Tat secretion target)